MWVGWAVVLRGAQGPAAPLARSEPRAGESSWGVPFPVLLEPSEAGPWHRG